MVDSSVETGDSRCKHRRTSLDGYPKGLGMAEIALAVAEATAAKASGRSSITLVFGPFKRPEAYAVYDALINEGFACGEMFETGGEMVKGAETDEYLTFEVKLNDLH